MRSFDEFLIEAKKHRNRDEAIKNIKKFGGKKFTPKDYMVQDKDGDEVELYTGQRGKSIFVVYFDGEVQRFDKERDLKKNQTLKQGYSVVMPRPSKKKVYDYDPYKLTKKDIADIANLVDTAIGNAFPDGDPFDELMSTVRGEIMMDPQKDLMYYLNKAAKSRKYKSYNDWLASVWDGYIADNPDDDRVQDNPWR